MRYPGIQWIPSPNFGYPRGTHGQLRRNIDAVNGGGEFWHSQQGRQAVAIAMFQNPATEVSAHFLLPKVGKPVQMVDSDDAAWHTGGRVADDPLPGGPGIGSFANLYFHGFEFEGGPPGNLSEPLTANQIDWGVRISRWLRDVHDARTIYVRRETLWEHNEVRATACPSGRIPWPTIISRLRPAPPPEEEDDLPLNAADKTWIKATVATESKRAAEAALRKLSVPDVTEIRNSLRGGDLAGVWWKVKGLGTIWFIELVGGILVRHSARNPQSYKGLGGDWKVIEVSQAQLDVTTKGPELPNLKV